MCTYKKYRMCYIRDKKGKQKTKQQHTKMRIYIYKNLAYTNKGEKSAYTYTKNLAYTK